MSASGKIILFLTSSPKGLSTLMRRLSSTGRRVVTVFTPDHAVALCCSQDVEAVVIDQELFVVEDWSVARSIKLVKNDVRILLIPHAQIIEAKALPQGVDAVAPHDDLEKVLATLHKLLPKAVAMAPTLK